MNERYLQYDPDTLKKLQGVLLEVLLEFRSVCDEHGLPYFLAYGTALGAVRHGGCIPWDDDLDVGMLRADYEKFLQIYREKKDSAYEILSVETTPTNCCTVVKLQKKNTLFMAEHSRYLKNPIGIAIDIFPFDDVPEDPKLLHRQMLLSLFWGRLLFLRGTPRPYIPYTGAKRKVAGAACYVLHYFLKLIHLSSRWIFRKFEENATRYNGQGNPSVACLISPVDLHSRWSKEDIFPLQTILYEGERFTIPKNNDQMLRDTYGDYMKLPEEADRVNHRPRQLSFDTCTEGTGL